MAANLRIQLSLKMAVGPLHPVGKADVHLTIRPETDGTARVDITRVAFMNNFLYTFIAGMLKDRMASEINNLVRAYLRDLPRYIPQVEGISILEIENDSPA